MVLAFMWMLLDTNHLRHCCKLCDVYMVIMFTEGYVQHSETMCPATLQKNIN